ncbi:bacteriocin-like protein [Chryseobacterium lineare]
MKNLKKLTRKQQEKINGAALKKCTSHSQCVIGWCCNMMCVEYACIEE